MLDIYCGIRYYHLQVWRRGKQHKSGGKQGNLHRQRHVADIIHASLTFSLKQRRSLKVIQADVVQLKTRLCAYLTSKIRSWDEQLYDSWHWIKRPCIKMAAARARWSALHWRLASPAPFRKSLFFSFSSLVHSHVFYKYNTDEFTRRHLLNGSNNHSHN